MKHRVVITGMGLASPLGNSLEVVTAALRDARSGVVFQHDWARHGGLRTRLAAPVAPGLDFKSIDRHFRRGMGPQALYAAHAAREAVAAAGLEPDLLADGRVGVAVGSTMGSPEALHDFFEHLITERSVAGVKSTAFLQCMGHTCAANVALMLGVTGRVLAPLSACASGSQSIGLAAEQIRFGLQDVMIAGGADECHYTAAGTFDIVGGTSVAFHDTPDRTPRPFDADRDGLVVGAGAGVVVLERLEHAVARGAPILAYVHGFATNSDGTHMSQPQRQGIERCMRLALEDAGAAPDDLGYVNAHATATPTGDPIEAAAITALFGDRVPVSSTKGQTGHTLGACGALETIFTVLMMKNGFLAGTRNLERIDPACEGPWHLTATVERRVSLAMNNNFAFGGVNTSLVLGLA